jgi:hypothetical protein
VRPLAVDFLIAFLVGLVFLLIFSTAGTSSLALAAALGGIVLAALLGARAWKGSE